MPELRVFETFSRVPRADWDACVDASNPFVCLDFFLALEESGCASSATGWKPLPALLYDDAGQCWACCPLYLKTNSMGEFVFDYGWADAYHRAGGRYYPKLQMAVPFTPVPGPRVLCRPGISQELLLWLQGNISSWVDDLGISSFHCTFCDQSLYRLWGKNPKWLQRLGVQFHWHNHNYANFDEFLSELSARKRKAIKKERETARSHGLQIEILSGGDLQEHHWDAFFDFYMCTTERKWGDAHLNRDFFSHLTQRMADRVVLMLAKDGPKYVAGAINLQGEDVLFGRNWGCIGDYPCLHFEVCYYQAIEYAIANKFVRVEAGAQGMHKVARGYLPAETYSLHYIRDEGFREAVGRFVDQERLELEQAAVEIEANGPFRKVEPKL